MTAVFTAYVSGAPTAGLTPTWSTAYNANTGVEITVGLPAITDRGSGLYTFDPIDDDFTGIVDLGSTAAPRYRVYKAVSTETFGAFDPDPLAGLTPSWLAYKNLDTGANVSQPTITELGNGLYKFTKPAVGDPLGGVVDLGSGADPRYLKYEAQNVDTGGGGGGGADPVLSVVSPAAGGVLAANASVVVDVTDDVGLAFVELTVTYAGGATEVIARDADFRSPYTGSRAAITDGYRYTVTRSGGWPEGRPRFEAVAVDVGGGTL